MNRAGRNDKRGLLVVREPSGRLSRASMAAVDAVSPAEAARLRQAAAAGMRGPEWATEIGRLFLDGKIDAQLFEAGKRWGRLVEQYRKAIGAPKPYPRGQAFMRAEPSHESPDPLPDTQAGRDALERLVKARDDIIRDMRTAHGALMGAGMLAERAVRSTCEENEVPVGTLGHIALKDGLEWLALHWGITQQKVGA